MKTPPRIIPERIREAREAAGLTDEQFAESLDVSRQFVGKLETGQAGPGGDTYSRIIAITNQPPNFFTTDRMRKLERFGVPNWRSLKRMQRPDRLRITRKLEWAYDVVDLIEKYINLPSVNIPDVEFDFESDSDEVIECLAELVREKWGLGLGPIADLPPLLEYNGIVLLEYPVKCEDMDAVSRWQGGRPYILYSRETKSNSRRIFNLAHELGHIILHSGVDADSNTLDRMERQANRFAGAFLLPRKSFPKEVVSTSIDYFLFLKERWRVAVAAMAYRCKDLSILNANQIKYIWKQMNSRGIRKSEPLDNAFNLSSPTVLDSAVSMLLDNEILAPTEIGETLALNSREIEELCGLPEGRLETKIVQLRLIK